ncbi:10762_t:CDS:2 [Dentiscutata erythropus]|uniref:10762_t:CDS:1 n=1 Tax=Dentiscutata erythropus TaxID=1348616 RepID=A0A9N9FDW2_9GLOM|nr:10762_t:CDS:2 [Dentiscutata erythropus]
MTLPDPIWYLFIKLGYIPDYKKKQKGNTDTSIQKFTSSASLFLISISYKVDHITKSE